MFEHIHMFERKANYDSAYINKQPEYKTLMEHVEMAPDEHQSYTIEGLSRYLLSHPMTVGQKQSLIYIQSFSYMQSGPSYYTRRDSYRSYMILYTYDGSGTLEYCGKTYELSPGYGFIIDCNKPHMYATAGDAWHHSDLHIYGGNSTYLFENYLNMDSPLFYVPNPGKFQHALEDALLAHVTASQARDFTVSVRLNSLLELIYSCKIKKSTVEIPDNIRFLQQYIEQHFDMNLSTDELAGFANLSKYHMIRQFKNYTGFTPHEYIIHIRLLQAESMLQMTDLPSYQIGAAVGFSTEAGFIRHFKNQYGMTPGQYRWISPRNTQS